MRSPTTRAPRRSARARTSGPARPSAPRSRKQPPRPLLTSTQRREALGVLIAGAALLAFVAAAPAVRAAFGWGWPLVIVAGVGGGLYLVWPKHPPVRAIDVAGLAMVLVGALGLLAVLPSGGGYVGAAISGWAAAYLSPAGAVVLLGVLLLLGLIVVFHFSPAATLGALFAGYQAARSERERLNALVAGVRARRGGRASAAAPALAGAAAGLRKGEGQRAGVGSDAPIEILPPRPTLLDDLQRDELPDEPPAPRRERAAPETSADPDRPNPAVAPGDSGGGGEEDAGDGAPMRVVADYQDDEPDIQWKLPSINLLETTLTRRERMADEIKRNVKVIEHTLTSFGVAAKVVGVNPGPAVTQYEVQPSDGVPVRRITALQNDLALALAASPLRIEAPIPGKSAVGIEVPNKAASLVTIREVVSSPAFSAGGKALPLALGNDVTGQPISGDLTRMPHLLIAGATGQGKSVCINVLIGSLLLQNSPADLKLVLIDPKRVEMSAYKDLPHLAVPVLVEAHQAAAALRWAVAEMDRRYKTLSAAGVRNIQGYNQKAESLNARPLPYVVIVIDELADLMMVAAGEVEELICRIAQLARAVGIHLVIATQRPSTDIITGLIKANIPSRVAFAVGSQVDSRVVLDRGGAEKLLGRGDMLYQPVDAGAPTRIQGAFMSDAEVDALVGWWKEQGRPRYLEEMLDTAPAAGDGEEEGGGRRLDPLFARAARAVAAEGAASVSLIQRKFNVGYSRAGRIVDQLAEHRVIGGYQGSKSREVLMNLPDVDELMERIGLE